jgi:hypothetical protein
MSHAANVTFSWRDLPAVGASIEHPRLRQPISFIIDDPMPGYNPAYFHSGFRNGPERIPPTLVDDFADLLERTGMRGKFSIVPIPFGFGRVDREVQGVSDVDRRHFLDVVRTRVAPFLDITPEALTHWNAIDLNTGQLLPYWEHVWSRTQTTETLIPYLALGLEILNNVNIPCSGHTSPWDFGDGIEDQYAAAILEAQKQVNGRTLTWYFLQLHATALFVPPQLSVFNPAASEAVVSVIVCDSHDFGAGLWRGAAPDLDMLISEDGQSGRLVETLRGGGSTAFHSHWQTMFSQGSYTGIGALETIVKRLDEHYGDTIAWTGCEDLARYTAAAAAVRVASEPDGGLRISSPFTCSQFTLNVASPGPVRGVRVDDKPLERAANRSAFREGSYLLEDNRLYACWPLSEDHTLTIEPA